jgi:hypothetical protein
MERVARHGGFRLALGVSKKADSLVPRPLSVVSLARTGHKGRATFLNTRFSRRSNTEPEFSPARKSRIVANILPHKDMYAIIYGIG